MIAIGISYDDFWHGDPELIDYHIQAYELGQKNHMLRDDALAWNIGRYVMIGVADVIGAAISKTSKPHYPSEPILPALLDEEIAAKKREAELIRARDNFLAVSALIRRSRTEESPTNAIE